MKQLTVLSLCFVLHWLPAALAVFTAPVSLAAEATNTAAASSFETAKIAAENGDPKAQYDLGRCYEKGSGVPQDYGKAAEYVRRSAEQGYADAQALLGSFYGRGLGVSKDPDEAVKWYRKAAGQGHALSQYALGNFYSTGRGVPKNPDEAVKWWRQAAAQNYADAQNALGEFYFVPSGTGTNHFDYQEAAAWFRKAAEQGHLAAMNNLGVLYEGGSRGVRRDFDEAAKWYGRAAEGGNAKAQAALGLLYLDGRGVKKDLVRAYAWLELSASQGFIVGRNYIHDLRSGGALDAQQIQEADEVFRELHQRTTKKSPVPVGPQATLERKP